MSLPITERRSLLAGLGMCRPLTASRAVEVISTATSTVLRDLADHLSWAEMSWFSADTTTRPVPLDWDALGTVLPEVFVGVEIRIPRSQVGVNPAGVIEQNPHSFLLRFHNAIEGGNTGRMDLFVAADAWEREEVDELVERARDALSSAASAGIGDAGYLTWDTPVLGMSPYEAAIGINGFHTDWSRWLFGYYPGNLLSSRHREALRDRGDPPPGWLLTEHGDWAWIEVAGRVTDCTRADTRRLRAYLDPLLPAGLRSIDEYRELVSNPGPLISPPPYHLL